MDHTLLLKLPMHCRTAILMIIALSGLANLLALTGPIYMLQVYDRVLTSRSLETLATLSIIAALLYVAYLAADLIRSKLILSVAAEIDEIVVSRALETTELLSRAGSDHEQSAAMLRDADTIRAFLTGSAPTALLDLPWIPIFLLLIVALSWQLAVLVFAAMLLLLIVSAWVAGRGAAMDANLASSRRRRADAAGALDASLRGLVGRSSTAPIFQRFLTSHRCWLSSEIAFARRLSTPVSLLRTLKSSLQVVTVGAGSLLVIDGQLTAGALIAVTIAGARALAPVDNAINAWKELRAVRMSTHRLSGHQGGSNEITPIIDAGSGCPGIVLHGVSLLAPTGQGLALADINLSIEPGTVIGLVGTSGSGKSAMARIIAGITPPSRGTIRVQGATPARRMSARIGYLPQRIVLHAGTIGENIADFAPDATAGAVVAACRIVGVHEAITKLPAGYETNLRDCERLLPASICQRIALARAFFANPAVVVLDEPSAHLDAEGEAALVQAIDAVKARNGIVVIVAQRRGILSSANVVAELSHGRLVRTVTSTDRPSNGSRRPERLTTRASVSQLQSITE